MNKPLFKSIRTIQASSPSFAKKKLFIGLFFVAVILSASLTFLNIPISVSAESSITKPSIPEFTVKFIDSSYDVPTTYSIDPYTGANVTNPSHRVENKTIELTIKNQPFVSTNTGGWNTSFYYNVRIKGHFNENWITLYSPAVDPYLAQANSDNTVITFQLAYVSSESGYSLGSDTHSSIFTGLPSNAQLDFQVEAMIGYVSRTVEFASWSFTGQESGWSNTQTITIDSSVPTATPNTSPSPSTTPQDTNAPPNQSGPQTITLLGLDWVQLATLTLLGIIAVLLVVVIVFLRKRSLK